jgi:hypothetical protein
MHKDVKAWTIYMHPSESEAIPALTHFLKEQNASKLLNVEWSALELDKYKGKYGLHNGIWFE